MKKKLSLLLSVLLLLGIWLLGGFEEKPADVANPAPTVAGLIDTVQLDEEEWYYSAEDVALYLHTFGHLPNNYITKDEARSLGWEGGSVEKHAPGLAIGGDSFGNREGLLPEQKGRWYYECDVDTYGKNDRGSHRLVYSSDGLIYYTEDHYESFTLLYGEVSG